MNDYLQNMKNGQADKARSPKTRKKFDNAYPYSANSRFNTYGSNYPNTRGPNAKRSSGSGIQRGKRRPVDDNALSSKLVETLGTLNNLVDKILRTQDDMITVQERNGDMLERQAIAVEGILKYLHRAPVPMVDDSVEIYDSQDFEPDDMAKQQPEPDIMEKRAASQQSEIAQQADKNTKKAKKAKKTNKAKSAKIKKDTVSTDAQDAPEPSRKAVLDMINNMRKESVTYAQIAQRLVESKLPTFSGRGVWHAQTIHRLCSKERK